MKNPLKPAGIEPATFRFVEQHLKHCAAAVPTKSSTSQYSVESTVTSTVAYVMFFLSYLAYSFRINTDLFPLPNNEGSWHACKLVYLSVS